MIKGIVWEVHIDMTKEELITNLKTKEEIEIYYDYLLGQDVWYFQNQGENHSQQYDTFKKFISKKLNIPFNNISIVGSAKTKFSFSPQKNFSEFHNKSDFDLIIVSNTLFEQMWNAFREVSHQTYLKNYSNVSSNIFNHFISIKEDDQNYENEFLISWQQKIFKFKAELQLSFEITHNINYRIYHNWEAVQDYHLKGISQLKGIINETN